MPDLNSDAYVAWKSWSKPDQYGRKETRAWDIYHELAGLERGSRVLEIGFGAGSHLHYGRSKGFDVIGLERNEKAFESARSNGLPVHNGTLKDLHLMEKSLDAVFAFDVFEHIPLTTELVPLLKDIKQLMKPDGVLVATFPNAASPFGGYHQNGDLTHVNAFTKSSIEQLGVLTGWKLVWFADAPEHVEINNPIQLIKYAVRWALREVMKLISRAYHDDPIGLVAVAVLKPTSQ